MCVQKNPQMRDFLGFGLFFQFEVQACFFAVCADLHSSSFGKGCPLKIGIFSCLSGRIELGGTNTVGVFSSHEGSFITNET